MSGAPIWLPPLIHLEDHGGDWSKYIEIVYAKFHEDFIASQPKFNEQWVRCRRDPIVDGKEAGFWHCTSEGKDEQNRTPDVRRCERIAWARAIIEHAADPQVDTWVHQDGGERRVHIWFAESYLVVLGERRQKYQLITAFCTDREHTIRKKRQERDAYKRLTPPPYGDGVGTPSTHGG